MRRPALTIPTTLSVVLLAGCGSGGGSTDAAVNDGPATDTPATDVPSNDASATDVTAADACADPNRLPNGSEFGCWTCPTPPSMPTMHFGQPQGLACSVCTPHPAITMRPRGDCYACRPEDGGALFGFC